MWDDFSESLDALAQKKRLRKLCPYQSDGLHLRDSNGISLINFGSNDYLGLSSEGRLRTSGNHLAGATASGLVCGWTDRHQVLADSLASFEQTESAVLYPSGFAACSGAVSALARENDVILSDELNHASLIDGCRLSRATCVVFPHRDTEFVNTYLAKHRSEFSRAWILTDSVFSMDGHVAPLQRLCEIAEHYDATMLVDEAHATGVLGRNGSGACEALGVKSRIPIRIGTLSKALGGQGGFVVGPKVITDFLVNHSRSLIFSTALALPAVETAICAIECVVQDSSRRERVRAIASKLRNRLGLACHSIESGVPIVPVTVGEDTKALDVAAKLRSAGLFVPAIRPPTVPENQSRLRVSLSALHSDQMLDQLAEGLLLV